KKIGLAPTGITTGGATGASGGLPQRFTFDPLRRHYLIASYIKPKIHDDWTVSATLIASLNDLSGLFSPSVAWTPLQWLTLSLYGFVPIRGIPVGQIDSCLEAPAGSPAGTAKCKPGTGRSFSEYDIIANDF